jgi:predicted DNA-binding transcriptional regulator AlpA
MGIHTKISSLTDAAIDALSDEGFDELMSVYAVEEPFVANFGIVDICSMKRVSNTEMQELIGIKKSAFHARVRAGKLPRPHQFGSKRKTGYPLHQAIAILESMGIPKPEGW